MLLACRRWPGHSAGSTAGATALTGDPWQTFPGLPAGSSAGQELIVHLAGSIAPQCGLSTKPKTGSVRSLCPTYTLRAARLLALYIRVSLFVLVHELMLGVGSVSV